MIRFLDLHGLHEGDSRFFLLCCNDEHNCSMQNQTDNQFVLFLPCLLTENDGRISFH